MQRIGIDVRLTYYRQGGIAEYMRQLVNALSRLEMPYWVKTLHNYRAVENLTPSAAFRRVNCYTPCHHRFESVALGTELLPHRLDLLHSPDFIPPRWGAKHRVITVHDLAFLLFRDIQTPDSLRYYAGQIERAVRQADHIIAVSQATKTDLMRLLNVPADKISVTWEGIHPQFQVLDQAAIIPILRRYGLPDDYLLFVGTIEPRKNLPNLLRAYAILMGRLPGIPPLVLAGQKGWLAEASFQAIEDYKLGEMVIWVDKFAFSDLPALYNGAKLHLFPSLYEGFGLPPLEAMACGTPNVLSDRGSLREVAGEAALYTDPDDPENIAEVMQQLLGDPGSYTDLVKRGLERVKLFNWQETAQKTLAVYRQVLSR